MDNEDRVFLERSLKLLERWLPGTAEERLKQYEDAPSLYRVTDRGPFTHCLLIVEEDGLKRLVQLVFEGETVVSDCAAWLLEKEELAKEEVLRYLEEESDWEYWESEIVSREMRGIREEARVLLYTNAYTTKRFRRRGLFSAMIREMETFSAGNSGQVHLFSVISLDPDIACYGEDSRDEPYYYSMKDEPARLLNAAIVEKAGFRPLKLETDEPVEDGSILWFAVKHVLYVS